MEAYIGKCLDSLLIPEFDQVEVWVVNDGSKDRSSEIAHTYADLYPGSIHVLDKPNGNYGSCINAALPLCTGRYVKVLDADDTFDTEAFSEYLQLLQDIKADIILTSYIKINDQGTIIEKVSSGIYNLPFNTSIDIGNRRSLYFKRFVSMHFITYNRQIFKIFKYHQIEGVSYSDLQWSIEPLSFCKIAYFLNLTLYRYLLGRVGQTSDPKVIAKSLKQSYDIIKYMYNEIPIVQKFGGDYEFYRERIKMGHSNLYIRSLNRTGMSLLREYDLELKIKDKVFYDEIAEEGYEKFSYFKFIKYIRENNYPLTFRIPTLIRILMGLNNLYLKVKTKITSF